MEEIYDRFPPNLGEILGKIDRKSFRFRYQRVMVWTNGKCVFTSEANGLIEGLVENDILFVSLDDVEINPFMKSKFSFGEISTNLDRVMWSRDIFNNRDDEEKYCPDISSLFFKGGILSKITYTIHSSNLLIEFYK